jgi:hypothetical protein
MQTSRKWNLATRKQRGNGGRPAELSERLDALP